MKPHAQDRDPAVHEATRTTEKTMNVSKLHIQGSTETLGTSGNLPTSAIAIPLLPSQGSWVITGVIQAVRADGLKGPVTFFPRIAGSCVNGVATMNTTGMMPIEPTDDGAAQGFQPGGPSLVGANGQGLQVEIALQGVAASPGLGICWVWDLDVLIFATP
jgi:hypothetical protein